MSNFDSIISVIEEGFQPFNVTNERDAEAQLIEFLNLRFPNAIVSPGHTITGVRIDIVIEGTYAIELVTVDDESRLVALLHQILQSKDDFLRMAVVLIDMDKVPPEKIKNYATEYEKHNVKAILKNMS